MTATQAMQSYTVSPQFHDNVCITINILSFSTILYISLFNLSFSNSTTLSPVLEVSLYPLLFNSKTQYIQVSTTAAPIALLFASFYSTTLEVLLGCSCTCNIVLFHPSTSITLPALYIIIYFYYRMAAVSVASHSFILYNTYTIVKDYSCTCSIVSFILQ